MYSKAFKEVDHEVAVRFSDFSKDIIYLIFIGLNSSPPSPKGIRREGTVSVLREALIVQECDATMLIVAMQQASQINLHVIETADISVAIIKR